MKLDVAMRFGSRARTPARTLIAALFLASAAAGCASEKGSEGLPNSMLPGTAGSFGIAGTGAAGTGLVTAGTGIGSAGTGLGTAGTGLGTAGTDIGTAGTGLGAAGTGMAGDYINLAPPFAEPFTKEGGTDVTPAPPTGWTWYEVDKTFCRDGSKNGLYIRHTDSDKLLIYFEGGGACTTKGFCHFNPKSVNEMLSGDGESVLGSTLAVVAGRQQPGVYTAGVLSGLFDDSNSANPFKGWNMVYIPYCTGDVHFGSNPDGVINNVPEKQKFVGYLNNREFMSHLVPTFKDKVSRVIVTGASAGSFGAALNASLIADSFSPIPVDVIMDSGAPFEDSHWPACMQKSWRELWKLNDSLPQDCPSCFAADGGNFLGLADFLIDKHPAMTLAAVSAIHDEVIRLFFAPGQNDCATITTADPFEITTSQLVGGSIFPAADYEAGLLGVRAKYESTGRLSTYFFGGAKELVHQHTFRARFYESVVGGKTIAQFVEEFLDGTTQQVGP